MVGRVGDTVTDEEDTEQFYVEILAEMEAKMRRGPYPRFSDEPPELYQSRCNSFYRSCKGFIAMLEHQLGLRQVRLKRRLGVRFADV